MDTQNKLEDAILHYQLKLKGANKKEQELAYKKIVSIYNPDNYVGEWAAKYAHFFDTIEDFGQEFAYIFLVALREWKTREERGESKWGGSGKFQNYFISCLKNTFSNVVAKEKTSKKNLAVRCPLCDIVPISLHKHLQQQHTQLLFDRLKFLNLDVTSSPTCILCKKYRNSTKINLYRHYINAHTNYLFEQFEHLFPTIAILCDKPASVYTDNDEDESCIYEKISSTNGLEVLLNSNISPTQRQMIESAIDSSRLEPFIYNDSYDCDETQWNVELEDLKERITLLEVGEEEEW